MWRVAWVLASSILVAAACTGSPGPGAGAPATVPPATASPAPEAPEIVVSRRLGRLPERCPGPRLERRVVHRDYAPLFGKPPLFAGLYASYREAANGFVADRGTPRTDQGWRSKLLWVMRNDEAEVTTVRGANRDTGEPIVFEIEAPASTAVFDPASPNHVAQNSKTTVWGSYVYFPSAGCYLVHAEGETRRWRWGFGFGR